MDKNVANIMNKNIANIMNKLLHKNVDIITVNNKNYICFRYTTDKAIVVSTDSYHFIHVQHNGLTGNKIKKIIVDAILTQSFQDINSIAKNSDLFHIYNIVVNPDNLLFNDNYLEELKKFLRKDSIAYYKGLFIEMITFNNVNYFFKCIDCSKISHSGDITFTTGKIRVRVEVKNYNKYEKYQYDKFCYDLYYNSKISGWKYEIGLFVYLYDKNDENFYDINHNIVIIKGISKNSKADSPIIELEKLTSPFLAIPMSKTNRFGLIVSKIKPIFKKLLNEKGYKMITEGANNYKIIMEDKSTNTDPIVEDIEVLKAENARLKAENARLKAENARLKELLNTS